MRGDDVMAPILLVEDTQSLALVYESLLRKAGHEVAVANCAADGLAAFERLRPDILLLDLMLPDRDGLALMRDCLARHADTRVLVITANGSINRAVEAMRAGAYDFLVKPFDEQRLLNAVKSAGAARARSAAGAEPASAPLPHFAGFIGSSPRMQEVYRRVQSVARSMATVFISGESGTGKEVCAQAIHDASPRAEGPFIPLNCAAIPTDLLESEVFGHIRGAFTGAISDKAGAAAMADGGTLFLDEICEMDLGLQSKLLRFLQTSTIQPLGASKPRKVDVRIVCATNRDPLQEVEKGRFREDLFYRLHVVPIELPPLRDRGEDVISIAEAALARYSREEGKSFTGLTEPVRDCLRGAPWPGNVRQLLNVMRNVAVLGDGPEVTLAMLPPDLVRRDRPWASAAPAAGHTTTCAACPSDPLEAFKGMSLAEIERQVIEAAIARHGGSVPRAARELEVAPSTLYRKREAWAAAERA